MGDWDLMAHGSYNGPKGIGWCPAGWTSYERAEAGWLDLTELQPGDTVRGMKSMDEGGEAYAIYNDANRNEYYLLENHKHVGWDAYTPEEGLLAIHVDYDSTLFANNIVNTTGTFTPAEGYDGTFYNDHARMVPFSRLRSLDDETYYYTYPMVGKRFVVDSLTDLSKPAAMVYNAQADGSLFMHKPVRDIAKDAEGNISFNYMTTPTVPTAILSAEQAQTNVPMSIYGMGGEQPGHGTQRVWLARHAHDSGDEARRQGGEAIGTLRATGWHRLAPRPGLKRQGIKVHTSSALVTYKRKKLPYDRLKTEFTCRKQSISSGDDAKAEHRPSCREKMIRKLTNIKYLTKLL